MHCRAISNIRDSQRQTKTRHQKASAKKMSWKVAMHHRKNKIQKVAINLMIQSCATAAGFIAPAAHSSWNL
jgi:hypothetical protein